MTAYTVRWQTPSASGTYTGIYPHQGAAIRLALANNPGAVVLVKPVK
jgi:hypothetical protein